MPKRTQPFNLIILGDPGAGKATQAAYISKKYKMLDFDMGRELALLRERDKNFSKIQARTGDRGILTPTKIVRRINREKVLGTPLSKGILFDGHPKMLGEAKIISRMLKTKKRLDPLVIYIKIPSAEVIKRIQKRKGYYRTKFNKRADDSTAALKNRAKYYRKNISEVISFFKTKYHYKMINGMGTRTEVRHQIQEILDDFLAGKLK